MNNILNFELFLENRIGDFYNGNLTPEPEEPQHFIRTHLVERKYINRNIFFELLISWNNTDSHNFIEKAINRSGHKIRSIREMNDLTKNILDELFKIHLSNIKEHKIYGLYTPSTNTTIVAEIKRHVDKKVRDKVNEGERKRIDPNEYSLNNIYHINMKTILGEYQTVIPDVTYKTNYDDYDNNTSYTGERDKPLELNATI